MITILLSMGAIFCAIATVTISRNSVEIVIYLIAVFICAGSLLIYQGIGFLGLSYLVVYVGGVAVIFLFVVIMFNIRQGEHVINIESFYKTIPYTIIACILYLVIWFTVFPTNLKIIDLIGNIGPIFILYDPIPFTLDGIVTSGANQIKVLGHSLLIKNSIVFFTVAIVLLLALLGPIVLCVQSRKNN